MTNLGKELVRDVLGILNSTQISEFGYQSPLEVVGLVRRRALDNTKYYGKHYQYAIPITDSFLRYDEGYLSTSGWRPRTYNLNKPIIDNEFEQIKGNFETF